MKRFERVFSPGCLIAGLGILICFTTGAVNINGSGVSLHLATTDLSSSAAQTNDANVRALFAGTPVVGIISTSGAGAKIIIEPMNLLAANDSGDMPMAEFSADPRVGGAPLEVQFQDLSSGGLYQILSWTWDFGDGSPYSSEQDPNHWYESPGSYTVTLTLMTTGGTVSTSKENYIAVVQQVPALDITEMLLLVVMLIITGTVLIHNRRYHNRYANCY
ncbi:MAG TPA: PKD domain-containing protein [Candidatus Hydrogenedentes bacterium]|nr:MAG: PKD domain protein [Candidatus Hydrogenedentes bacterium ADurb.Bin101]HQM99694.1 PKD domain-containing protein [Candidatus Hydrogenedentota bacterium]